MNNLSHTKVKFSIAQKLWLVALINIGFVAGVGYYAMQQMDLIGAEIHEIATIDMPLVTAITTIEIHQLEQAILFEKAVRLAENLASGLHSKQDVERVMFKFNTLSAKVDREIIAVEEKTQEDIELTPFEDDKIEFKKILKALKIIEQEHKEYAEHSVALINQLTASTMSNEQINQAIERVEEEEEHLDQAVEALLVEIEQFTAASLNIASEHEKNALNNILIIIVITAILSFIISFFMTRLITRPIVAINILAKKIAEGNLDSKIELVSSDEIAELAVSINQLVDILKQTAEQADAISQGDYSQEIHPRSDKDRLGIALHEMKKQIFESNQAITQANADLTEQSLLKTQIANINELTQGATELQLLADEIIASLADMVKAGHGVFYIRDAESTQNDMMLMGSYAFKQRKNVLPRIAIGEGLIGQCAKEKKTILLTNAPADYIQINSALGEQTPLNIIAMPILFEQALIGAIELASFTEFGKTEQYMLEKVAENLGVVINNILSQQKTKLLLEETQRQTEELQAQQEELESSNESLLEQTQLLKLSEEELKQQSEELRVSNEELSEKQTSLQQQKEQIETSQKDLTIKANELALASKYKSEFLANMSHELRTPLNSMLLLAKGLADNKQGHLDSDEVEDARIIHDGGNSLLSLINDILDLSKVEAGKLNVHIEELKIVTLVNNLVKMFKPIASSRGLTFETIIGDDAPAVIISDGQRVEQILRNLLSNAMKFTEQGKVMLNISQASADCHFSHSNLHYRSTIAIAITDTGIGIPKDKMLAIFEAFQQQDGSISRKFGGTGLGLTIARELTRLLGGEIQLQSKYGEGSTFTLFLPFKHLAIDGQQAAGQLSLDSKGTQEESVVTPVENIDEKLAGQEHKATNNNSNEAYAPFITDDRNNIEPGEKTLLVIDDDKVFAKILRNFANEAGYKCLVAGDGRSGIYLAQQYLPNGIVLDMKLPDIDGNQVLEQLKFSLKTRHIPVEIISAHADNKTQALLQGAIGLLVKPVTEEQLQTVLDKISDITSSEVRNILLIEDDAGNSKATSKLLKNSGISITCVDNGADGITEIQSDKYDCVILDLGLPDMTGFDVLKQLSADTAQKIPPIIIYTGKEITDDEERELQKYSSTIVIKGVGSAERLLDDVSLFMHNIESKYANGEKERIHLLHDEDLMLQGRKILLADDDMRNTYALSKKLLEVGFEVEMANNGKEALELLQENPDTELVLMDTMMPVMDGYEATKQIRRMKAFKDIPIIALTAKTMPDDRDKSLQAGASEYLTKPIDFDKLLSIMRIWLFKRT